MFYSLFNWWSISIYSILCIWCYWFCYYGELPFHDVIQRINSCRYIYIYSTLNSTLMTSRPQHHFESIMHWSIEPFFYDMNVYNIVIFRNVFDESVKYSSVPLLVTAVVSASILESWKIRQSSLTQLAGHYKAHWRKKVLS